MKNIRKERRRYYIRMLLEDYAANKVSIPEIEEKIIDLLDEEQEETRKATLQWMICKAEETLDENK